jgi:hypothetical protein
MKKINYYLLLFAILCSFSLQARKVVVNTAALLQTAFNGALDADTIQVKPGIYDTTNKLVFPKTGAVVVESFYRTPVDSVATIRMAMQTVTVEDGTYTKRPSLIFNNLKLTGRYNDFTSSTYMIDFNGKFISIDTLAFRNCEISGCARSMIRGGLATGKASCGDLEWFEMTNCKVHDFNGMDTHSWPIVYLAHVPMYVTFKNNSFYDIPYNKSIYQLTKMTVVAARAAEITFENNLVATTYARADGIIATGAYLSEEAKFFINNNMFIIPKFADAQNLSKDSLKYSIPPIVKCKFGIITANNNIVDSMRPWISGQSLDVDGQGGFIVIDTLNTYRMRNLNFDWSDFANAQGNDFSYFSSKQPATAGTNGKPIGDPRWIKSLVNPRTLTVSANIAGAVVTPQKGFFEDGSSVTIKASAVNGYTFKGWHKVSDGSLISTDNPYTFNITSDMNISAKYEALQSRIVTITVSGSKSASYTITPKKDIYYEGDVITIALNTHYLNNFLGWNDGNTDLSRTVTIAGNDVALTANFTEQAYLLAWDFHQLTGNNQSFTNLAANHAADINNPGVMNYVTLDTIRTVSTRNNKFTTVGLVQQNCVARRTLIANFGKPDYLFIKFSTKGLTNLGVKSEIATDNSMFKVQKLQYALDGKNYVDFKADTISGSIDMIWKKLEGSLPVAAENQDSVFVRWIADTSSERLFVTGVTASDYDYAYISKIIVTATQFSGVNDLSAHNNFRAYGVGNKLILRADVTGKAEVYALTGQKTGDLKINEGVNEFTGFKSGIYLVRFGSEVQKVIIR